MAQWWKAGPITNIVGETEGRYDVDFLLLEAGDDPKLLGYPHTIEVTYRPIDDVLKWQIWMGTKLNRSALWEGAWFIEERLGQVGRAIRAALRQQFPDLPKLDDPQAVAKMREFAKTRRGQKYNEILTTEVRPITERIRRFRAWFEDAGKPPRDLPAGSVHFKGKARKDETLIYNEVSAIQDAIARLTPFIGERNVDDIQGLIDWPRSVLFQPPRTDRITTVTQMIEHLHRLRNFGFMDWFELNINPRSGLVSDIVKAGLLYLRRINRFILLRVPTFEMQGKRIRTDKNRILVFAPALFRTLRAISQPAKMMPWAGKSIDFSSMFANYVPVIRTNEMATRETTMQAVHESALASQIGEDIETVKRHGRRWPCAVEMSLTTVRRMKALSRGEEERTGGATLAEKYQYAKPVGGGRGDWSANLDLVWFWVYGVTRQSLKTAEGKRATEGYSIDDVQLGVVDQAINYIRGVLISRLNQINVGVGVAVQQRRVLRGDYRFVVSNAMTHAQELIQFLEEEKRWKIER